MGKYGPDGKKKTVNVATTTKYDGRTAERYLELCRQGGSIPEFCRNENIARSTLDDWCAKYPVMAEAKRIGKKIAEGWWMGQARENLVTHSSKETGTTRFDTSLYKFYTGGRFGHTSEKDLEERMNLLEAKLESQGSVKKDDGYAEEAAYEENHDGKVD